MKLFRLLTASVFVLTITVAACNTPFDKNSKSYKEIQGLLDNAAKARFEDKDFVKTELYEQEALDKMSESMVYSAYDKYLNNGKYFATQKVNLVSALLINNKAEEAQEVLYSIDDPAKYRTLDPYLYSTYLYYLGWSQYDLKDYEEGDKNIQESIKVLEDSKVQGPETIAIVKEGYSELKTERENSK